MKPIHLMLTLVSMIAVAGCQREAMSTTVNSAPPADTTRPVVTPDTTLALDTATLPNLYLAYIYVKTPAKPYDSSYYEFGYRADVFDTVMSHVQFSNSVPPPNDNPSFSFFYQQADPIRRYTTYYDDPSYVEHRTFEIDYFLSNGLPYYIESFNGWHPETGIDSTRRMYFVYDGQSRLKEILNYKEVRTVEDLDNPNKTFFDDRNFVYDADGNILSDEVQDSGDVMHYKKYQYEYSNKSARICVRKNSLPFSQCRIFNHSRYLFEHFFKREVVRITETDIDLTSGSPVTTATIIHSYSYEYNSRGWVKKMTDNVNGGSAPGKYEYAMLYYTDGYFQLYSAY